MNESLKTAAWRAVPALALMALIFYLSHQPNLSSGLGVWDLIGRKFVHLGIYALLTLLWFRALRPLTARAIVAALAISIAYAVSDEFHQSFIEGRSGSPIDVAIDALGASIAAVAVRRCLRRGPLGYDRSALLHGSTKGLGKR